MPADILTDAIVLRAVDYGEADRVATLYTRAAGKVAALARGARKSRKRFGGALELFGAGEARLKQRRGELWSLEALDGRRGFPHLALDVAKVAHGAYVCELVRELSPEHSADERLFDLLDATLGGLDAGQATAARLRRFEMRLLDVLGLLPSLERCVGCGVAVGLEAPADPFDVRRGGVLCARCAEAEAGVRRTVRLVPRGARALLAEALRDGDGAGDTDDRSAPRDAEAARDLVQALLAEHLPRPLRSVAFIAKLRGTP